MKRSLVTLLAIAGALISAGTAAAGTLSVAAPGSFSGAQPAAGTTIFCGYGQPNACSWYAIPTTAPNESQVRWGQSADGSYVRKSGLGWSGSTGAATTDFNTPFDIGRLQHFNNAVTGTFLSSVVLTYDLNVQQGGSPLFASPVPVTVVVDETTNVAPCPYPSTTPCSDKISWTLPTSTTIHNGGGVYVLNILGFKDSASSTSPPVTDFISNEGATNDAFLFASLDTPGSGRAHDDHFTVDQGATLTVGAPGVRLNDVSSSPVTALAVDTPPGHGTLSLSTDGGFTYTPAASFAGTDSFIYRANYADGQVALATATIDVQDTTKPVVSAVANQTIEATSASTPAHWDLPTASDPDDAAGPVSCSPASDSGFPMGTTTVTCSSTDTHGNTGTSSFTVTIRDTTVPSISCPDTITVESGPNAQAFVTPAAATATDNSGSVTVNGPAAGSYPLGTTTVTYVAIDASGNSSSCSSQIEVVDTTPPSIACPAGITVEADRKGGASVTPGAATASDIASAVTISGPSPGVYPLGTTTVTYTATDASGNTSSCTSSIAVVDTTPPSISCPAATTVEADRLGGANVTPGAATASDIASDPTISGPAPGVYPLGATTVTFTATDSSGNHSSCSSTITVVDTTPPSITCPAALTVEADRPAAAAVTPGAATASDIASAVTVAGPAAGVYPLGTTTVTYTATDAAGNTSSCTSTIQVVDTTSPTLTVPADITVDATSVSGAVVSFTATATDIADPHPGVSCTPTSGITFAIGSTTVSCTATDASGNATTKTFKVTVKGAGALLNDLSLAVRGLPPGQSLPQKVKQMNDRFNANDIAGTCTMLAAFVKEVTAQSGKQLSVAQATDLLNRAKQISAVLGCP